MQYSSLVRKMADKMKVGVIGAGYWGKKHVDEFSKSSVAELAAVSDLSEQNLEFCRSKYNVKQAYSDYKELLANPDIEAVSVCTHNEMHYEVAKAAMLSGKHVLVEKPLTNDVETSKELIGLSKKQQKVLCVGHLFRFNNAVRKLKELHEKGFFGRLFFIKIQFTNHNTMVSGRTVLTDLGPHAFDIQNFITGMWPEKSVYIGSQFRRSEMEEVAFIESDYGNGFFGFSEFSWLLPEKKREVFIVGDKAAARADLGSQKVVIDELITDRLNREGGVQKIYETPVQPNNALAEELESFVVDCRQGRIGGSINSGEVGLKVNEVLLSCSKADSQK